jgi:hypothetical protein
MDQEHYYSVFIHTESGGAAYTVCAVSDYAAARQVRSLTGYMADSDRDVMRLPVPETASIPSLPAPARGPAAFCGMQA